MNKEEMEKYGEVSYKNRDLFLKLYLFEGFNTREMADLFDVCQSSISYWRKKHGIKPVNKKNHIGFIKEVYEQVGCEYSVLSKYKGNKEKVKIKHNKCGHIYKVAPGNFLNRESRCPKCSGKIRKDTAYFKSEVLKETGGEYSVLGEYKNNHTKIKIKHNKCEHTYKTRPNDFLAGKRCPKCNSSKGEKIIRDWLKVNSFYYKEQKSFQGCVSPKNHKLNFDFYLPNYNVLIEYQGVQHYEYNDHFHRDKETFRHRRKCDQIKRNYCKDKSYKLIEIPYWEKENIEGIIKKELQNINARQQQLKLNLV